MTSDHTAQEESSKARAPGIPRPGILLVNLGSPDEPNAKALRRYLKEFLSDRRVVDLSRPLWWFILNVIILNVRPARSAKLYAEIWTDEGAPLLAISRRQRHLLEQLLRQKHFFPIPVALGMRYGNPGIGEALESLRDKGCDRVLVLPLYPQYSCATTATAFDALADVFKGWRDIPALRTIHDYHDHPGYIAALAASVREAWEDREAPEKLLVSFHGLPRRYAETGDPYRTQCENTAGLLAQALGLAEEQWILSFQSRFGREEWLRPYTDETLRGLARSGVKSVDVICPGFAADCLETLEEIAVTNKSLFLTEGGERYHYIPALNERPDFIDVLGEIVMPALHGWGVGRSDPDHRAGETNRGN